MNGTVLAVVLNMVFVPLWFCFVCWALSFFTGWRGLARRFPAPAICNGEMFRWCSLRLWPIGGYNNALAVTLCPEGVLVVPEIIVRLGHAPLLFPWSAVGEPRDFSMLGRRRLMLPLKIDGRTLELFLPPSARAAIDKYRGSSPFSAPR